jgi:hypothetical protein
MSGPNLTPGSSQRTTASADAVMKRHGFYTANGAEARFEVVRYRLSSFSVRLCSWAVAHSSSRSPASIQVRCFSAIFTSPDPHTYLAG